MHRTFALLVLCLLLPIAATAQAPARLAIRAGKLIDGRGEKPLENPLILVEGDKVASVTAGGSAMLVERLLSAMLASPRLVSPQLPSLGSLRRGLRVALLGHPERPTQRWSTAAPALVPAILPKTEPDTSPVPPG